MVIGPDKYDDLFQTLSFLAKFIKFLVKVMSSFVFSRRVM